MSPSDPLADYFVVSPRGSAELAGRDGVQGTVDAILNELEVPAELDADGDWRVETDVGPFLLVIDKALGDLVAIQTIRKMDRLEDHAADMYVLLQLNLEAEGARFAALNDGDTDLLLLTARLRPDDVSLESVGTMLHDTLRLSRTLDELVGAPTQ
ncbi:MAG: hypothetical protein QOI65_743 [Thermoleophilaceae bacterium]|nr:hypothetical protein [Thermoleophilaceae bacterium]